MTPPADPERYKNHRFPGEIISHGVWLYYRFTLSYDRVPEQLNVSFHRHILAIVTNGVSGHEAGLHPPP